MDALRSAQRAQPTDVWLGKTDHRQLNIASWGARVGVGAAGTFLLLANSKSKVLSSIILAGGAVGQEAVAAVKYRNLNADEPKSVKDFRPTKHGWAPVLRGVTAMCAVYGLSSCLHAIGSGKAGLGKIMGSIFVLSGTTAWSIFTVRKHTHAERDGEAVSLKERIREWLDFPEAAPAPVEPPAL